MLRYIRRAAGHRQRRHGGSSRVRCLAASAVLMLLVSSLLLPAGGQPAPPSSGVLFSVPVDVDGQPLPLLQFRVGHRPRTAARAYIQRNRDALSAFGRTPDSFGYQLQTMLERHIRERDITLPPPPQPLVRLQPRDATNFPHMMLYQAGEDPAHTVGDYLSEHEFPAKIVTQEVIDGLNAELVQAILDAAAEYSEARELFAVPVTLGALQERIVVREGLPVMLAANAFCVSHISILDENSLSVAECALTVSGLIEKLHDQILQVLPREEATGAAQDDGGKEI